MIFLKKWKQKSCYIIQSFIIHGNAFLTHLSKTTYTTSAYHHSCECLPPMASCTGVYDFLLVLQFLHH
jgi:hypothetical protein